MTTNLTALLDSCDFLLSWQKEKLRQRLNEGGGSGNGFSPDGDLETMIPASFVVDIITTVVDDVHRRVLGAGMDMLTPLEKLEIGWAARDSVLSHRAYRGCWSPVER